MVSLENANAPESIALIVEIGEMNATNLASFAVNRLINLLSPSPLPLPPLPDVPAAKFEPKFGAPLFERKQKEKWQEAALQAKQFIEKLKADRSTAVYKEQMVKAFDVVDAALGSIERPATDNSQKLESPSTTGKEKIGGAESTSNELVSGGSCTEGNDCVQEIAPGSISETVSKSSLWPLLGSIFLVAGIIFFAARRIRRRKK
jgi:hypothetical protein